MPVNLFSEFIPQDKKIWEAQAQRELKDKFDSANRWEPAPGLFINSYVTADELDPRLLAEVQSAQKKTPGWLNISPFQVTASSETNISIRQKLTSGADAILLEFDDHALPGAGITDLLQGIDPHITPFFFKTTENPATLYSELSKYSGRYSKGGIAIDPLSKAWHSGQVPADPVKMIAEALNQAKTTPEFRPYMVDTGFFTAYSSNVIHEIAFSITTVATYMDLLTEAGITPSQAFSQMLFSVSIGTQYLTEIAKLRAMRFLLQKIARAYLLPDSLSSPFFIGTNVLLPDTGTFPYTHLISSASQAMSAVVGGCDAILLTPFEHYPNQPADFASRVARNVSPILRFESALNQVADPAAGSYFLEKLTLQMADSAWDLFLSIEENGGLPACFQNGFVKRILNARPNNYET